MSRGAERVWAVAGGAALFAAILLIRAERLPISNFVLGDACRTPVTLIEPADHGLSAAQAGARVGEQPAAIVLHGLSANRRVMLSIGQTLARSGFRSYLLDSPGEGDSTLNFSFAAAENCATSAIESLAAARQITISNTMLVGHSLGGAIAIRLADQFPDAPGTIAVSPAPLIPPRHVPANVLILSAQFDPPQLAGPARRLVKQLGGIREAGDDFRQRRAVGFRRIPLAMHSSVLADSQVNSEIADWSRRSLGLSLMKISALPEGIVLSAFLLGGIGIVAMMPLLATWICSMCRAQGSAKMAPVAHAIPTAKAILGVLLASVIAAALLIPGVPLRMLRLYSADYLASFLSLAGLIWLVLLPRESRASFRGRARDVVAAIIAAGCIAAAIALWTNWQFADLWPNAPRWLRLPPVALIVWPYFAAEEAALGPINARPGATRWFMFGGLRFALLLALVLGYFGFASGEFLPILISPALALISVGQRAASDLLQRRTRSLAAAATLDAILAAWFMAAAFPLR